MAKEKSEQTAFGVKYEEFCKISDDNNKFDVRYPDDSLSNKTLNKRLDQKQ